jgi:hypothetical protein
LFTRSRRLRVGRVVDDLQALIDHGEKRDHRNPCERYGSRQQRRRSRTAPGANGDRPRNQPAPGG